MTRRARTNVFFMCITAVALGLCVYFALGVLKPHREPEPADAVHSHHQIEELMQKHQAMMQLEKECADREKELHGTVRLLRADLKDRETTIASLRLAAASFAEVKAALLEEKAKAATETAALRKALQEQRTARRQGEAAVNSAVASEVKSLSVPESNRKQAGVIPPPTIGTRRIAVLLFATTLGGLSQKPVATAAADLARNLEVTIGSMGMDGPPEGFTVIVTNGEVTNATPNLAIIVIASHRRPPSWSRWCRLLLRDSKLGRMWYWLQLN